MALSTFRNPSRRARRRCFVAVLTAGCAAPAMSASAATTIYTQSNFSDVANNVHFVALVHADLHRPPRVLFAWGIRPAGPDSSSFDLPIDLDASDTSYAIFGRDAAGGVFVGFSNASTALG